MSGTAADPHHSGGAIVVESAGVSRLVRASRRLDAALLGVTAAAFEGRLGLRGRHLFAFDCLASFAAAYIALALSTHALVSAYELLEHLPLVLLPVAIRPGVAIATGLYRRVWRYASLPDLIQIGKAIVAGTFISLTIATVIGVVVAPEYVDVLPPAFWVMEGLLSLTAVGGIRLAIRMAADWRAQSVADSAAGRQPTLLFGAGTAGTMIVRSALREPKAGVRPVGFLDDDPVRRGQYVSGLPVFGGLDALPAAVASTGATMLLIATPSASGAAIRRAVDAAAEAGIEVRTVPPLHELMDGTIDAFRVRPVRVEDLLGRPLAAEHSAAVEDLVRDRVVLVTGAGGSIGSELTRQLYALRPRRLVLVDRAESPLYTIQRELEVRELNARGGGEVVAHLANIASRAPMRRLIADCSPDIVFHAAAYKHVPLMEEHPSEAVQVNVGGTLSVLDAAIAAGVPRFVFVSTDKAVEPTAVMGATKRVAEALVADAAAATGRDYVSVRFGNVLGSAGSVVPIFLNQLEHGEPLTVTDPHMTRYFMTIPEAGRLILDAAGIGGSGALFVLEMGEPIKVLDLARELVRLSGRPAGSVPIRFTGLRPGEKLHEQLVYAHEELSPTGVPKVLRVAATPLPGDVVARARQIVSLASGDRDIELRAALFDLVHDITPGKPTSGELPVLASA